MKRMNKILFKFVLAILSVPVFTTSCSDEPLPENYYTFTGEMVSDYLMNRSDNYSEFITVLQRSGIYGMMATYGTYTCFAPTNEAIDRYLRERGLNSVDQLSKEDCDTLSWNHIIDDAAYFTTDLTDGNIPTANMNERYLTFSCDSDALNDNNVIYYINKSSRLVLRDDSVENGVVHTLDRVIVPNADLLPDLLEKDSTISIFCEALRLTGLCDSLKEYIDPTYFCGKDSTEQDMKITTGGGTYTMRYVAQRMKRYTAFVEKDEIYRANGINDIEDLKRFAKQNYDEMYPEDAGLYDEDYTNRKNPLNRFVAYHLLPYYGAYNDWTVYGDVKTTCARTDLIDCTDWYTTFMPGTIMKMSTPSEGLFINRKGVGPVYTVRGTKVLAPSEIGDVDQQATNGIYHYIDDILLFDKETRDVVFNDRIRINAVTLSPEFMNCGARGNMERATGFKVVEGWDFHGKTPSMTLRQRGVWMVTYADCVDMVGQFDVTFKLPPVPREDTYEVRFAYGASAERGVVQVYFGTDPKGLLPMGLPIDFRIWGGDPSIGWVEDTGDEETDRANDRAMHNRGYMKDMDSWAQGGVNILRAQSGKYRKILTTQNMKPSEDYYVRIKLVVDNPQAELPINYFELCPKGIYAGLEAEDTH